MAQGMELLDNGTKVFTGPGAAFGTDALLLAGCHAAPQETALDLCSGCGIVALAGTMPGTVAYAQRWSWMPMLRSCAAVLCRKPPGAEHITALCTDLRTSAKGGPEQGKYDFAACNPPYFTGG